MTRESFIEDNVIRNRERELRIRDAVFIRRCRMGIGFGVADVVFFPTRGPHRLVVVEAKQANAPDAVIKVVGQLLMYYTGALQLGDRGLRLMRRFAAEHPTKARSTKTKSLKVLSGGISPPERAWEELCKGKRLSPSQIALYVALNSEPSQTLMATLSVLAERHELPVGVVSVMGRNQLELWPPRD